MGLGLLVVVAILARWRALTCNNAPVKAAERIRERNRRRRMARAVTESMLRISKEELARGKAEVADVRFPKRPKTRGDCLGAARPCPFAACKWHLALDVSEATDSIKHNYPDSEPGAWPHSCALDEADRGGLTLERVGALMNLTRERVRQIEARAYHKLAHHRYAGRVVLELLDASHDHEAIEDWPQHTG